MRSYEPELPPWWRKPWVIGAAVLVLAAGSFAGYQLFARSRGVTLSPQERERMQQVAVLYFQNPDQVSELDPVAEGLTDALIRSLREANVQVRGAQSVAAFRGKNVSEDSIARALKVGTLIEGSVVREGQDRVKITTWLTDASGNDLGQRTNFNISRDSLFAAEEKVARNASEALRAQLGTTIDLNESRARAANLRAWTLYQSAEKARKDAEQVGANREQAIPLYARSDSLAALSAAADPKWIDPLLLRAEAARQRSRLESDKAERAKWIEMGKAFVEQALELDRNDANALALRGTLRYAEWYLALTSGPARDELLKSAAKDLQDAVLADKTLASAYAMLSIVNYSQQDVSLAATNAQRAYQADAYLRNADFILFRLFWTNYDLQNFPEATKWCNDAFQRFPADPRFTACQLWLMLAPSNPNPSITEAWRLSRQLDSLVPKTPQGEFESRLARLVVGGVIGRVARGTGISASGPYADSARHVLERAADAPREVDPTKELLGNEAVMLTRMGDHAQAIRLLKLYMPLNPDHSFRVEGQVHWWWQELRNLPEFQPLLSR
jgi:serine/threonine-protein kinase